MRQAHGAFIAKFCTIESHRPRLQWLSALRRPEQELVDGSCTHRVECTPKARLPRQNMHVDGISMRMCRIPTEANQAAMAVCIAGLWKYVHCLCYIQREAVFLRQKMCMCTLPTEQQPGGGCQRQTVGRHSRHGSTAHATLSGIPERPHSLLLGSLARLQALVRTAYNQAAKRNTRTVAAQRM